MVPEFFTKQSPKPHFAPEIHHLNCHFQPITRLEGYDARCSPNVGKHDWGNSFAILPSGRRHRAVRLLQYRITATKFLIFDQISAHSMIRQRIDSSRRASSGQRTDDRPRRGSRSGNNVDLFGWENGQISTDVLIRQRIGSSGGDAKGLKIDDNSLFNEPEFTAIAVTAEYVSLVRIIFSCHKIPMFWNRDFR